MLRLVRLVMLVLLFVWVLGLALAISRPETGAVEDVVLVIGVGGLFALAVPVRRLGARPYPPG